jgi:WD repeat-containing protein 35
VNRVIQLVALKTALRLVQYEDVLPLVSIYSLIAVTALSSGHLRQASRAFMKLESSVDREQYSRLAFAVFNGRPPRDPESNEPFAACPNDRCGAKVTQWATSCDQCHHKLQACIASGRSILSTHVTVCPRCKHQAYPDEMKRFVHCPLCHASLSHSMFSVERR